MANPQKPFRIYLADEHPLLRKGLSLALSQRGWQVVGEADSGKGVLEGACQARPNLVILGVELNGDSGLDTLTALKGCCPEIAVLVYTGHPVLENLLRAVELGACGFILKSSPEETLLHQVEQIARGEYLLDTRWRLAILNEIQARASARPPGPSDHPLTRREVAVLRAIGAGLTTPQIAQALTISVNTVGVHIRRILHKLRVSDRTQALVWAARNKVIRFD